MSFLTNSFEIPWSELKADHLVADIRTALETAKANIQSICDTSDDAISYDTTFAALEDATEQLGSAWGLCMHLDAVSDNPEQREAIKVVLPEVSAFFSSLNLNTELWQVLKKFIESPAAEQLSATKKRFVAETAADFTNNGADLPQEEKDKVAAVLNELSELTKQFSENVLDSTNAWELIVDDESELDGLPESAKAAAKQDALAKGHGTEDQPKWRFSLQFPSMYPVLQHAKSDSLRKQIWEGNCTVGNAGEYNNEAIIWKILAKRQELCDLLGKANFSDHVLERRMARNGETALKFVEDLHAQIHEKFLAESDELEKYRAAKLGQEQQHLEPWEVAYWTEQQRKELYSFDEEELRPYFPVDRVMRGMFDLCETLFGIKIQECPSACIIDGGELSEGTKEVWHPECKFYELHDEETGTHLGSFYADWHPRESKRGGAWMNPMHTGKSLEEGHEPHWGVIIGNMTKPVGDQPALLTHREVETIFHEFGHLLHHLLGDVEVRSLSGANVAWDFVELPSQIMENFCWDRESLDLFARHYETGETIPEELFEKMLSARNYMAASAFMRQLCLGKLDLELHQNLAKYQGRSISEVDQELLKDYKAPLATQGPSMALRFSHLFSGTVAYASGYYSYKWAEVLDADAFTRFQEEGVTNELTGRDFRECILSKGNSEAPDQLFHDFMGRDPDQTALLVRCGLATA